MSAGCDPNFRTLALKGQQQQALSLLDETEDDRPAAKVGTEKATVAKAAAVGNVDKSVKRDWPKGRAAQAKAVLAILRDCGGR